ncbi:hypothetical protein OIU78_027254 [Salix suchowensis]|nr:hypothetical protein OIU78_027254 [Salix suchowensis]
MNQFSALEKYRYEQSLEHTSQFIEKLEKELENYQEHVARFKKRKEATVDSTIVDIRHGKDFVNILKISSFSFPINRELIQ